jgi:hypothetical protein
MHSTSYITWPMFHSNILHYSQIIGEIILHHLPLLILWCVTLHHSNFAMNYQTDLTFRHLLQFLYIWQFYTEGMYLHQN